ncbi:hypothetical protein EfsSVR2331_07930 [Enterococcus faecalis]|nr:hypothetical protein EfsSVR2331_07930 [Enterococcus faecalis]
MLAALVIYFVAGIRIDFVTLPVVGMIDLRWFSLPLTLLWILAITNAVNLIDGLDGLASGVSIIGLTTIGITGYFFLHAKTVYIPIVIFILVASIAGFFPYNFYPAKIFLGDTGALFLGFMIAVMSLQGLKKCYVYYGNYANGDFRCANYGYGLCNYSTAIEQEAHFLSR